MIATVPVRQSTQSPHKSRKELTMPKRIDPDGTFRMANGPEMRALLCEFILEAARRAR